MRKYSVRWFKPRIDCLEGFMIYADAMFPAVQLACLRFDSFGNATTDHAEHARIKETIAELERVFTPRQWSDRDIISHPFTEAKDAILIRTIPCL